MATLNELSNVDTPRGQDLLAWMLRWSPFFRWMEERAAFFLAATKFDRYPDDGKGQLQSRGIGGGYTRNAETTPPRQQGELGFVGDSLAIDRSHVVDHQRGLRPIGSWFDPRFQNLAKSWVRLAEAEFMTGTGNKDGSERRPEGLLTIVDGVSNVAPWSSTLTIDAVDFLDTNPDHLDLSIPDHQDAYMEAMEQILPNFEEPGIINNRQLAAKLGSMARERTRFGETLDSFGNRVETLDGVPILRLNDGSIPNDYPDNAGTPANVTTKQIIASPGRGSYEIRTHGLEMEDEFDSILEDVRSGKIEWEFRAENAIEDKLGVWVIRNIKAGSGSEDYFGDFY